MVTITAVTPGTPAAKKGIQSGDVLLSVNGHEIHDVLDYRFYGSDADAVLRAGFDVRHCVVGAGVSASHGYERSHKDGLVNTFDLVSAYIAG